MTNEEPSSLTKSEPKSLQRIGEISIKELASAIIQELDKEGYIKRRNKQSKTATHKTAPAKNAKRKFLEKHSDHALGEVVNESNMVIAVVNGNDGSIKRQALTMANFRRHFIDSIREDYPGWKGKFKGRKLETPEGNIDQQSINDYLDAEFDNIVLRSTQKEKSSSLDVKAIKQNLNRITRICVGVNRIRTKMTDIEVVKNKDGLAIIVHDGIFPGGHPVIISEEDYSRLLFDFREKFRPDYPDSELYRLGENDSMVIGPGQCTTISIMSMSGALISSQGGYECADDEKSSALKLIKKLQDGLENVMTDDEKTSLLRKSPPKSEN